jgi:hypothetical protein
VGRGGGGTRGGDRIRGGGRWPSGRISRQRERAVSDGEGPHHRDGHRRHVSDGRGADSCHASDRTDASHRGVGLALCGNRAGPGISLPLTPLEGPNSGARPDGRHGRLRRAGLPQRERRQGRLDGRRCRRRSLLGKARAGTTGAVERGRGAAPPRPLPCALVRIRALGAGDGLHRPVVTDPRGASRSCVHPGPRAGRVGPHRGAGGLRAGHRAPQSGCGALRGTSEPRGPALRGRDNRPRPSRRRDLGRRARTGSLPRLGREHSRVANRVGGRRVCGRTGRVASVAVGRNRRPARGRLLRDPHRRDECAPRRGMGADRRGVGDPQRRGCRPTAARGDRGRASDRPGRMENRRLRRRSGGRAVAARGTGLRRHDRRRPSRRGGGRLPSRPRRLDCASLDSDAPSRGPRRSHSRGPGERRRRPGVGLGGGVGRGARSCGDRPSCLRCARIYSGARYRGERWVGAPRHLARRPRRGGHRRRGQRLLARRVGGVGRRDLSRAR